MPRKMVFWDCWLKKSLIPLSNLLKPFELCIIPPVVVLVPVAINLKDWTKVKRNIDRLMEIFSAHNIGYFFYNGGGDSQSIANKVSILSQH